MVKQIIQVDYEHMSMNKTTLQKQSSCFDYSFTMLGMWETIPLHTVWRK